MTGTPRRRTRSILIAALLAIVASACEDTVAPETRVTTVEVAGGDGQQAAVGTALPQAVVARALDAEGRPISGARVEWRVTPGVGSIVAAGSTTDADGRASATWTLGTTAGAQTAVAEIGTATATFQATATAGPAASVVLVPSTVLLDAIGATTTVQTELRDAHDNAVVGREPTWTSTDAAVFTVDGSGTVTAVGNGTAQVRATLDGVTGEAEVTVTQQTTAIVVNPPAPALAAIGATVQLQATANDRLGTPIAVPTQDFVWSSSNPLIVSVNASGLATAAAAGTAQVSAALGAVTGSAQVTVTQTAATLTMSPKTDTLTSAVPTSQLVLTGTDVNGQPILQPTATWTSSNTAVATVSQAGLVTAVSNGTTIVKAVSGTAADSATIVVRLNTPPKPVADALATTVDVQLTVAAPGLLANDTLGIPPGAIASFGGGSLTASTVVSFPAGSTVNFGTGGSLTVNANGSLVFVPSAGFMGSFTFQYRVLNVAGSADATVTIAVGSPATAVDDAYATTANTSLVIPAPGVLANDTQGFPTATVTSFGGGTVFGTVTSFTAGQGVAFGVGGFLQLDANGAMSVTPPTNFTGVVTFQYRITNGLGTSDATVTITVN